MASGEGQIGNAYTNKIAGKISLTTYIAQSQRQLGVENIGKAKFFSLLMDGFTDKAGVDNEVLMAVWYDINSIDEKIHTQTTYFHIGIGHLV